MSTAGQLEDALARTIDQVSGIIEWDLCGVTYIDSRGVAALVTGSAMLDDPGRRVVRASRIVKRILDVAGVLQDQLGARMDCPD